MRLLISCYTIPATFPRKIEVNFSDPQIEHGNIKNVVHCHTTGHRKRVKFTAGSCGDLVNTFFLILLDTFSILPSVRNRREYLPAVPAKQRKTVRATFFDCPILFRDPGQLAPRCEVVQAVLSRAQSDID
jgi:hypothetical protein